MIPDRQTRISALHQFSILFLKEAPLIPFSVLLPPTYSHQPFGTIYPSRHLPPTIAFPRVFIVALPNNHHPDWTNQPRLSPWLALGSTSRSNTAWLVLWTRPSPIRQLNAQGHALSGQILFQRGDTCTRTPHPSAAPSRVNAWIE